MKRISVFILLLSVGLAAASDGHSRGHLPLPTPSQRTLELLASVRDSGVDISEVTDLSTLNWPSPDPSDPLTQPPWQNKDAPDTRVYRSEKVAGIMAENFSDEVPGIEGVTFQDVFNGLRDGGCPVLVLGGMVRDSLLGKAAKDTDVAFMCSADKVVEICDQHGWPHTKPKGGYVKIGHESEGSKDQMEGKTADTSLFTSLVYNEFACNTLFFDTTGNGVIVDKPGTGVKDTLGKIVRVAARKEDWSAWAAQGGLKKVLRFWKMRVPSKGFTPEGETLSFVLSYVKDQFASSADESHKRVRSFFESRMAGLPSDKAAETLVQYRDAMRGDLGAEWYDANVRPYEPPSPEMEGAVSSGGAVTMGGFARRTKALSSRMVMLLAAQQEAVTSGKAADDVHEIVDKTSLKWPSPDPSDPLTQPPWQNKDAPDTRVYRSEKVAGIMAENFSDEVPGIEGVTFQDVFNGLRDGGCPVLVLGGMVRDSLLGKAAKDTDVAFMCSADKVVEICDQHGWPHTKPKGGYVKIGHESEGSKDQMEGKTADTSLFTSLVYNEFACNTLFFDTTGNGVIVDKPGTGVKDTLGKIVRVAARKEDWSAWAAQGGLKKVLRFWKMRVPSKGFTPEGETLSFVLSYVKDQFASSADESHKRVRSFFESRMAGLPSDKAAETLVQYRDAMRGDLGAEWYDANVRPYEPKPAPKVSFGSLAGNAAIPQLESTGESDVVEIKDFSKLHWPYEVPKPWDIPQYAPNVRLYRSEQARLAMAANFNEKVPGLDATFQDVFDGLRDGGCPVFVVGGMVRDALRGKSAKDTDVAYLCDVEKVAAVCDEKGWAHSAPKRGYIKIGHESEGAKDQMEGKQGSYNLYTEEIHNEFACNTLFYDTTGNDVIVDKTGFGVEDTLASLVRIPGTDFNKWFDANGLKTLLRYFKMRVPSKGFSGEPETATFVKKTILDSLANNPTETHEALNTFFNSRMSGLHKEKAAQTLFDYRNAMIEDLGKAVYDSSIRPFEPSCPYNLVADVEPFVRSYAGFYQTSFKRVSDAVRDSVDGGSEVQPTVTGRSRSSKSVYDQCIPLDSIPDIVGIRVVVWRLRDVETVKARILALEGTRIVYSHITESPEGYRSVDIEMAAGERSVLIQIRTPQMTDWADWWKNVNSAAPELLKHDSDVKKYAKETSEYLERVEEVRNRNMECPSLLRDSVFNAPDVLTSRITTGCFVLHDQLHGSMTGTLMSRYAVHEQLQELRAGPVEQDCGPDFPKYSLSDAREFVRSFADVYHHSLAYVKKLVPFASVTGRLKTAESLYDNLPKKCKAMEKYKDIVGLRVTVETIADVKRTISILSEAMGARAVGDPEAFSMDMLGYRSVHMYPKVAVGDKPSRPIEIQLRTPLMTVWADWAHDVIYKGDVSVREDKSVQNYMLELAQYTLDMDKVISSDLPECPRVLSGLTTSIDMVTEKATDGCFHHDLPKATLDDCRLTDQETIVI